MELHKVTINWYAETHVFYTHAEKREKAVYNTKKKLHDKFRKRYSFSNIKSYLNGSKDNIKVEIVT